MKRSFIVLFACLLCTSLFAESTFFPAPVKCRPVTGCYTQPFVVDAYATTEAVNSFGHGRWSILLTSNDQTRRVLHVRFWDWSQGEPSNHFGDGYVGELYPSDDAAKLRFTTLSGDQQAGAFLIPISPDVVVGGGTLLVFRTFSTCPPVCRVFLPGVVNAAR